MIMEIGFKRKPSGELASFVDFSILNHRVENTEQAFALARLFQAAPALLLACREALQGIECYAMKATAPERDWVAPRGTCDCWGCNTSRQLHAAIKEAGL